MVLKMQFLLSNPFGLSSQVIHRYSDFAALHGVLEVRGPVLMEGPSNIYSKCCTEVTYGHILLRLFRNENTQNWWYCNCVLLGPILISE